LVAAKRAGDIGTVTGKAISEAGGKALRNPWRNVTGPCPPSDAWTLRIYRPSLEMVKQSQVVNRVGAWQGGPTRRGV